ncbi:MAG: hypothetical protein EOO39_01370 [Cytophagaceae bacterium]|nr:MAG: hypothetical protein EOO39_01370 [Cytophagaceae bacterium]
MRRFWLFSLTYLAFFTATAQTSDDWNRLRQYASMIGVDSLVTPPNMASLTRHFTEIVYGRTPRRMGFQNVPERIDTARINRLTNRFMNGADWCPLLDSLESHDRRYRQLKEYCMQCLTDDYMADSLTIGQVKETLNTYRWLNRFPVDKCVIVNLPAATLRLVDRQGTTLLSSRVIVGKPDTPTPSFTASIASMVLYPYWNVPRSIMTKELLPKIRKNPVATLDAMKMQVIDANGQVVDPGQIDWTASIKSFPYRLRQSTGCDNALGLLKFNVNDPYDIYLHDTNARQLFAKENRSLSHGCVRVEKPTELANLLLGQPRFSPSYLTSCPKNASPKTLTLRHAVPVIVLYNILDIDDEGAIRVYKDIYGWWRMAL